MASQQDQPTAMDEAIGLERTALVLKTLGWILLVFDSIVCVWIWMGLKSGSMLWLWWTLFEGFAGVVLLGAAGHYEGRAVRKLAAAVEREAADTVQRPEAETHEGRRAA